MDIRKHLPLTCFGESVGIELFSARAARLLFHTVRRRVAVEGRVTDFYEASFLELIRRGEALFAVDLGARVCVEVDTPEDLATARRMFGGSP